MIFGWLEHGRTDRWVLVDPVFPWPALHHGRNALRAWAEYQDQLRAETNTAGPRRMPWGCQTAVKDHGDVELRIWPCAPFAKPRAWTERDHVWRLPMLDLGAAIAAEIACEVAVLWTGSDGSIERAVTPPTLADRGFIGWRRGEKAPKDLAPTADTSDLKVSFNMKDLSVLPQGEKPWH